METPWYSVSNLEDIPSPALLIYLDRIDHNLREMLAIIGAPERLRPHVKTHKMPELIRRQLSLGIVKFKCATIAEAEMTAEAGGRDILLAYQPVGPNIHRLLLLLDRFPGTRFAAIADDASAIEALSSACAARGSELDLLLDIDSGMHRSGIAPGPEALALYRLMAAKPGLNPAGLHVYDGHIHALDPEERRITSDEQFSLAQPLRDQLLGEGLPAPTIVAGGSPTYPFHARRESFVECSPGTTVLWDAGYSRFQDLNFKPAALLLTRVVSKPGPNRLCLDLGHKSVASETPHPRVELLGLPEANAVAHSEEHLVVETPNATQFQVGDALYGIPWHICPTVALHSHATVVQSATANDRWAITARNRALSI